MRFLRVLGRSSKINEWLRPQLVGKTYLLNPPTMLKWAMGVARGFMSRRSMERLDVHRAHVPAICRRGDRAASSTPQPRLCPFAQQLLGGSSPAGLLANTSITIDSTAAAAWLLTPLKGRNGSTHAATIKGAGPSCLTLLPRPPIPLAADHADDAGGPA